MKILSCVYFLDAGFFLKEGKHMNKKMKQITAIILSGCLLTGCGFKTESDIPKVGVAQIVSHTSLNEIRDSFTSEMENLGYVDGKTIEIQYQDAANQTSNLNTIMANFADEQEDVIVAIATPTAQVAANYSDDIPVVFSAVSDPIEAGLVDSLEKPGGNITGTCDEIQINQMLDLAKSIHGDIKKIGFLYDAGEANSVSNLKKAKNFCKKNNLELIEATGKDLTELQSAMMNVLDKNVDIVFSPNDNTVASGMAALADMAKEAGVAYYVGADSMVKDGGFATVGINYTKLGEDTAHMVDDILKGKSPKDIPVKVFKDNLSIYINEEYAKELKIQLPNDIKNNENLEMVK